MLPEASFPKTSPLACFCITGGLSAPPARPGPECCNALELSPTSHLPMENCSTPFPGQQHPHVLVSSPVTLLTSVDLPHRRCPQV